MDFRQLLPWAGSFHHERIKLRQGGVREERKDYELNDPRTLAIKGLGQFRTFPVVAEFRRLVEGWCICDSPARRTHSGLGYTEPHGSAEDNLAQAALHLHEHHPEQFDLVLQAMRAWVPGLDDVEVRRTEDGRSLLRFKDGSFSDPLAASSMSHGTIKLFAYLVLLHSPTHTHCWPSPHRRSTYTNRCLAT